MWMVEMFQFFYLSLPEVLLPNIIQYLNMFGLLQQILILNISIRIFVLVNL